MKKSICVLIGLLFVAPMFSQAANLKDQLPAPKTKLEEFSAKTGVVIIRGFEEVGTVSGIYSSSITVEARELINATSGKKEYGMTIKVKDESGSYVKQNTSYIDYDEITSLISGIDYIAKVNKSSTKFSNFQADYNTKGSFKVSTYSSGGKIKVAIESGSIGSETAYFKISSLPEIRSVIEKAKNKIDSLKK